MPRLFWPTLLTLIAILILCTLGAWQVQRLHWKENLIAQYEAAQAAEPQSFRTQEDIAAAAPFTRARLNGRFGERAILITPRTWQGRPGHHMLAALRLADGGYILVNRGWIALNEEPPPLPRGPVSVSGLLRPPVRANLFTPANDPAANIWYQFDLHAMAQALEIPALAPLILYADTESSATATPVRAALRWQPANNHRQYAFFWFGMAGVLAVIYTLRFLRKAK